MTTLSDLAREIHINAVAHGFWEGGERNFGEQVALMHAELSEALEEHRKGKPLEYFEDFKPEGVAVELADCAIRCFDTLVGTGASAHFLNRATGEVEAAMRSPHTNFGEAITVIHGWLTDAYDADSPTARHSHLVRVAVMCRALAESIGCTDWNGVIDRKMSYNATRPMLHGRRY